MKGPAQRCLVGSLQLHRSRAVKVGAAVASNILQRDAGFGSARWGES